ncbi:hypothetical protein K438DRAFT_274369 [Mycena galopus ATCC 62051]|nr:hypothetical protein K438DRAFT_274369 [Mycena galopus ATCC 62051]
MSQTAFISGPMDVDMTYFATHYQARVDAAAAAGHAFVVGPVVGIDKLALHYLAEHVDRTRITVYMAAFEYARVTWREQYEELGVNVKEVVDAQTTRDRDAAMTRDSDYDILRYRTEEEAKELYGEKWWPRVSNTEMNERRRVGDLSSAYRLGKDGEVNGDGEKKREKAEGWRAKLRRVFGK